MAQVISGNQVKLNNGQTVQAQQGGWYDAQQFFNGSLSNPGQIHPQSTQQGAGQAVSQQVVAQTAPQNVSYVNTQRQNLGLTPSPDATNPTPVPNEQVVNPSGGQTPGTGSTPITEGAGGIGGGTGGTGGGGLGLGGALGGNAPVLNLPNLYQTLSEKAGVGDLEKELSDKSQAFNDAQSKINDNPFLSESSRTGRIQKLQTDYNNDIKSVQDNLAMKKADIQTQIDLQTKQFDINSQSAKQALDEFNTLLSSGALAGASGQDIAAITQATGISSSEIQAAISSQTQKDTPTSVQTIDDGTNQYAVVINTKTGQVISKSLLGASKPTKLTGGQTEVQQQQQYTHWAGQDAKNGAQLQELINTYGQPGGLSIDQIYQIYNANAKVPAKETLAQVKQGIYATQKNFQQDTSAPGYVAPKAKPFSIFGIPL